MSANVESNNEVKLEKNQTLKSENNGIGVLIVKLISMCIFHDKGVNIVVVFRIRF